MGYYVALVDCDFFLDKKHFQSVYEKMCELNNYDNLKRGGQFGSDNKKEDTKWNKYKWFSWMEYNYPDTCNSMEDILKSLGFELRFDDDGNLNYLWYADKTGNEDYFLNCFAGYAKDGSYLEFKGEEDGDYYRFVFKDGKMIHETGEVTINYRYYETYEFGEMSRTDKELAEWREKTLPTVMENIEVINGL